MNRLTEKDLQGNWCLKGMPWERLHVGQPITEELWKKLYGALWKLMEYEDTGLSPEEVEEVNKFEGSNGQKWLLEIAKHRWIPVSERLPEDGTYLCTLDGELCGIDEPFTGMCGIENGKWDEEGCVIAWQPLPAPYKGELNPKDPPHTCDTCRRYGKSDHNCYYCRHKERPDLWEAKEESHE